jgi:mono/diheme cytochrome c family protein
MPGSSFPSISETSFIRLSGLLMGLLKGLLNSRPKGLLASMGMIALISGCAGTKTVPMPTAKDVEYANRNGQATSLAALNQGRKLYIRRCSACHNLKDPASLTPADWPEMVDRMATNAELNPDQKRAITQYLVGVSAAAHDKSGNPPPIQPPTQPATSP